MSTTTRNCIRTLVVAGLAAWPTYETYRLWVAQQQLIAAMEQHERIELKLVQIKETQMAQQDSTDSLTPVSNPATPPTKTPSSL
jgi:hypothetical protein